MFVSLIEETGLLQNRFLSVILRNCSTGVGSLTETVLRCAAEVLHRARYAGELQHRLQVRVLLAVRLHRQVRLQLPLPGELLKDTDLEKLLRSVSDRSASQLISYFMDSPSNMLLSIKSWNLLPAELLDDSPEVSEINQPALLIAFPVPRQEPVATLTLGLS